MLELKNKVLTHVLSQIEGDTAALSQLTPRMPWKHRIDAVVKRVIPRLIEFAPTLIQEVELTLNSPQIIRAAWAQIKNSIESMPLTRTTHQQLIVMDRELNLEAKLLTVITGETVSHLIAEHMCSAIPGLRENNRSTYPDLYFQDFDYSLLSPRRRGYALGPARKGAFPTSVPDGIEIKSQRGKRIRVDCHHHHPGLHVVLTFDQVNGDWKAFDLSVAYLTQADYRRATRNTTATTEKFTFSQAPFISVITGNVEGDAATG